MQLSISDDDICSDCTQCAYAPGEESSCAKDFPAVFDADGRAVDCIEFQRVAAPGANWVSK